MLCSIQKERFSLTVEVTETGAFIQSAVFGRLHAGKSELFTLRIHKDGKESILDSTKDWSVRYRNFHDNAIRLDFISSLYADLCVSVIGYTDADGIAWETQLFNYNDTLSVMSAGYPSVRINGVFDAFLPLYSGVVYRQYNQSAFERRYTYSGGWHYAMQYDAFYNADGGFYRAVHDGSGTHKEFGLSSNGSSLKLYCLFPAINMGVVANSFTLPGKMVWKRMDGDWYDAALIYKKFVEQKAEWLPETDENGRITTPESFKKLPFWIMDWLPNTNPDADPIPVNVRPTKEITDPDHWVNAAIQCKNALGCPIGYHIYNWHYIPFNNDYPHYFPVKDGFAEGVAKLKENGIFTMPYINARLWDTHDRRGDDWQFGSYAINGAVRKEDGNLNIERYASHEPDGKLCELATMCPSSPIWKRKIAEIVSRLENEIGVNGVYLDQIAAAVPIACTAKNHPHLPGGGNWFMTEYANLVGNLKAHRPESCCYMTECNAEQHMKENDAFLTWHWIHSNAVPAFSVIYSRYVVLIGCNTGGKKRDDVIFFKSNVATSLLFGLQLGWINAEVVDDKRRFPFLKKAVEIRQRDARVFYAGTPLKPPTVESNVPDVVSEAGMTFPGTYTATAVKCGLWLLDGIVHFYLINISDTAAEFTLKFDRKEADLQSLEKYGFTVNGCEITGSIGAEEIIEGTMGGAS